MMFCDYEEALKIATGQANKKAPHVVVPFYMPLAKPMLLEEALTCCRPGIRDRVESGQVRLVGVAQGTMVNPGDEPRTVQFVLLHGQLADEDPDDFWLFDTSEDEYELAVLMNGDGTRYSNDELMTQEKAVALWIGGFLGWNEKVPGLYRLRYALIESDDAAVV